MYCSISGTSSARTMNTASSPALPGVSRELNGWSAGPWLAAAASVSAAESAAAATVVVSAPVVSDATARLSGANRSSPGDGGWAGAASVVVAVGAEMFAAATAL